MRIQYHIVALAGIARVQILGYKEYNNVLCNMIVSSLETAERTLQTDPMRHQDVLDALDALQLLIEPMVQLRRSFVLAKDADNLLKVMGICQLLNSLIVLTEVLHTLSHHNDHKDVNNSSMELFRVQMDLIFKELGIGIDAE
jgi:hypothetical protein